MGKPKGLSSSLRVAEYCDKKQDFLQTVDGADFAEPQLLKEISAVPASGN